MERGLVEVLAFRVQATVVGAERELYLLVTSQATTGSLETPCRCSRRVVRPQKVSSYRTAFASFAILTTLVVVKPCSAQGRLEFTGFVGQYTPQDDIILDEGIYVCPSGFISACSRSGGLKKQEIAPEVGGRLTTWFTKRWALDLSVAYAPSKVSGFPPVELDVGDITTAYGSSDTAASVLVGSARVLFSFFSRERGAVYLSAGWGFESRGGPAYRAFLSGQNTNWGLSWGIGGRHAITRRWGLRADVEDQRFKIRFKDIASASIPPYISIPPANYEEPFSRQQNDVTFSLGVSLVIGHE
jgi:hypothetical protein